MRFSFDDFDPFDFPIGLLDWLAQLVIHIPNKGESRRWRECAWLLREPHDIRKNAGADDQSLIK